MPLSAGDRLGPYEILAPLGAGGMGEVYRARDTKLNRDVAVKVLPAALADDAQYMARFEREAQMLAAVSHPNIAAIYGVEQGALIMELVEGTELAGPVPIDTALDHACQIAAGLEAAHECGIIHRDLKPANIKVTPDGRIKILDFGLAKAAEYEKPPGLSAKPTISPTLSMAMTQAGMILGTAAYMSPEQAHGRSADRRADIWSFGAVLFEMLSGAQAFEGESIGDTLASVLKLEPDWNRLPSSTPAAIRKLLRRCLTKDRKQRLQAIGDGRIAIEEAIHGTQDEASPPAAKSPKIAWLVAAAMSVAAITALWGWLLPAPAEPKNVVRLTTTLPVFPAASSIALSRDGSRLAYISGPQRQIYVRNMDQLEARALPGTDHAAFLCFSPDGQWISFLTPPPVPKLNRIAVSGGPPQILAEIGSTSVPPFQNWGLDDNILIGFGGALMRVPATGGKPQTLATADPKTEGGFFGPQLLPGGKQVLLTIAMPAGSGGAIAALNLQTGERKILVEHVSSQARYLQAGPGASAGYIVYYSQNAGSLMAVPFDASRLEVKGSPVAVVEGVQGAADLPYLAISDSGTLAYLAGSASQGSANTVVWVDRKGAEQPLPAPPRSYNNLSLSPDGRRIALSTSGETGDIWVYDLGRGTSLKITTEDDDSYPVWTADGKRVIYRQSTNALAWAPADNSGPPSIVANTEKSLPTPTSVSPDGKLAMGYYSSSAEIWVLPLPDGSSRETKLQPFLESKSEKFNPEFSPDGRWVAYWSAETGTREVYVAPYPGPGAKYPISAGGGWIPQWSHDGRELFYWDRGTPAKMMAVDVQTGGTFRAGTPKPLFEKKGYTSYYAVSPDGKRFLLIKPPVNTQAATNQVTVVLNWFEELRRRAPVKSK